MIVPVLPQLKHRYADASCLTVKTQLLDGLDSFLTVETQLKHSCGMIVTVVQQFKHSYADASCLTVF